MNNNQLFDTESNHQPHFNIVSLYHILLRMHFIIGEKNCHAFYYLVSLTFWANLTHAIKFQRLVKESCWKYLTMSFFYREGKCVMVKSLGPMSRFLVSNLFVLSKCQTVLAYDRADVCLLLWKMFKQTHGMKSAISSSWIVLFENDRLCELRSK